jgi:DNA-binding transcriptional LysR family regulator
MELRHLRYFIAVAEERHFGRAAERLGMAQPPLSQQIQALERELGTQLFRRVPRHLELTDAGEVFLDGARAILARTEQAVRSAERAGRGELGRICVGFTPAASFNAVVPTTIRSFRHAFPDVSLDLSEADTAALCRALSAGNVDVAFIRPPDAVDFTDLRIEELFDEDMLVALPTGHRLAASVRVPIAMLAGEPFILYPRWLAPSLYDGILAACCKAGFVPMLSRRHRKSRRRSTLWRRESASRSSRLRCSRYTAATSPTGRYPELPCGRRYRSLTGATSRRRRCVILSGWRAAPSASAEPRSPAKAPRRATSVFARQLASASSRPFVGDRQCLAAPVRRG